MRAFATKHNSRCYRYYWGFKDIHIAILAPNKRKALQHFRKTYWPNASKYDLTLDKSLNLRQPLKPTRNRITLSEVNRNFRIPGISTVLAAITSVTATAGNQSLTIHRLKVNKRSQLVPSVEVAKRSLFKLTGQTLAESISTEVCHEPAAAIYLQKDIIRMQRGKLVHEVCR